MPQKQRQWPQYGPLFALALTGADLTVPRIVQISVNQELPKI